MAALSNYLRAALLNATLRNTTYTSPATVYLALYTSDPTAADSGTEVSGGSYARQAVAFSAPSGGATDNSAQLDFPKATADWGTITHFGVRDAASGGNLLFFGALAASKTINTDDKLQVEAGSLDISLS